MRFSAIAITLLGAAASASASSLFARQSYPPCALTCISKADLGSCISTDYQCLCKNQAFVSSTSSCIASSCTGDDLKNSVSLAQSVCARVGVTLSSAGASSTAAASATPTAAKSGASTISRNAFLGLAVAALTAFSL